MNCMQLTTDNYFTMSIFCLIDDKHVPLYRILWVAELPHFCGARGVRAGRGV